MSSDSSRSNLHYKMAKKIAQLTKVIHHLNTINEDYSSKKEALENTHKKELDCVVADATLKINNLKSQLAEKERVINDTASELSILKRKYEKHQQDSENKQKSMLHRLNTVEEDMRSKYKKQARQLKDESDCQTKVLKAAVKDLKDQSISLKRCDEKRENDYREEVVLCKKRAKAEQEALAESHKSSLERLTSEHKEAKEKIRQQMFQEQKTAIESANKLASEKIVCLEAKLRSEHDLSMTLLRNDMDAVLEKKKHQHETEMRNTNLKQSHLSKELSKVKLALDQSAEEKAALEFEIKRLQESLQDMQSSTSKKLLSLQTKESCLQTQLDRATNELDDSKSQVLNLKKKVLELNENLEEKGCVALALEQKINSSVALAETFERKKQAMAEEARTKEDQLIYKLENEVKRKEELLEALSCRETESQRINEQSIALENKVKELEKENESLKICISDIKSKMEHTELALHKKYTQEKAIADNEKRVLTETMNKRLDNAEKAWKQQLENSQCEAACSKASAIKQLEEKLSIYQKEASRVQINLQTTICSLKQQFSHDKEKMQNDFRIQGEDKERAIQKLNLEYNTERSAHKREVKEKIEELSKLQSAMDGKVIEIEKLKNLVEDLKSQINEVLAAEEATKDRCKEEIAMTQDKYNKLVEEIRKRHDQNVSDQKLRHKEELEISIMQVKGDFEQTLKEISMRHTEEINNMTSLSLVEREKSRREVDEIQKRMTSMEKSYQEKVKLEKLDHTQKLKETREEHIESYELKIRNLQSEHINTLSEVESKHKREVQALKDEASEHFTLSLKEVTERAKQTLQQVTINHEVLVESIQKDIQMKHRAQIDVICNQHEDVKSTLQHELISMEKARDLLDHQLSSMSQKNTSLENSRRTIKSELSDKNREITQLKEQVKQEVQTKNEEVQRLKKEKDKELQEQKSLSSQEIETLRTISNRKRLELETELGQTRIELGEILDRWKNRESRPEDIEQIQYLKRELMDITAKEQKARKDMLFYKRELLNREENFNRRFSNCSSAISNNVGVMNIIKTKHNTNSDANSTGGGDGMKKKYGGVYEGGRQRRRRHTGLPYLPRA